MHFSEIIGQEHLKNHLTKSADLGRIPHAQLFIGPEGSGTLSMAIAYAQYVLCKNTNSENSGGNESCNIKFGNFTHPDLHFIYPTVTTTDVKTKPKINPVAVSASKVMATAWMVPIWFCTSLLLFKLTTT